METNHFQQGSLKLVKNKYAADAWYFRYRVTEGKSRVQRNVRIGSVTDLSKRRDAETIVMQLRLKINSEVRVPETVNELVTHYAQRELTPERKAFSTLQVTNNVMRRYILPRWGSHHLHQVRTVEIEEWL